MIVLLPNQPPILRVVTRPNDANPNGDIFGGWLMSQVDVAGAIEASRITRGPVVTRVVQNFEFIKPIFVGDLVSCYAEVVSKGKTSISIHVEVYTQSSFVAQKDIQQESSQKVADATLVYVAVFKPGIKRDIE